MAESTCSYEGCDRPSKSKGYCNAHYMQTVRGQELRPISRKVAPKDQPNPCTYDGCTRRIACRGLCKAHDYQRRAGVPLRPIWEPGPKTCSFDGCDNRMLAKGYCTGHYQQLRLTGQVQPFKVLTGRYMLGGYVKVQVKGHPRADRDGFVYEHVKVMSEMLGRPLLPGENAHHVNGQKADNRPENLELWVSHQPKGQRARDLLSWAEEIVARYGPERAKL